MTRLGGHVTIVCRFLAEVMLGQILSIALMMVLMADYSHSSDVCDDLSKLLCYRVFATSGNEELFHCASHGDVQ